MNTSRKRERETKRDKGQAGARSKEEGGK